ncbi:MAG: hypothetical protein ACREBB_06535 [Nitrosotalea sp.]
MTRILTAATISCLLVLTVITTSGILGTSSVANAFSVRDGKPHFGPNAHFDNRNIGTCPNQNFLAAPDVKGTKKILDITYLGQNDEDSGIGAYWALDRLHEHLTVWQFPNGTFYALKLYNGIFITPQGATDPAGTTTQTESSFGTMVGGYTATFGGTFTPGTQPKSGDIGTFNYGGTASDVLLNSYSTQKGDATPYDFLSAYFTNAESSFEQPHWGWAYKLDPMFESVTSANQWCNYNTVDGGNSGNIKT